MSKLLGVRMVILVEADTYQARYLHEALKDDLPVSFSIGTATEKEIIKVQQIVEREQPIKEGRRELEFLLTGGALQRSGAVPERRTK